MVYKDMTPFSSFKQLSHTALLAEARRLAGCERAATAALIAAIAEIDERRLYLGEGCPSMFAYCTCVLHLTEHAAYDRIEVSRLSKRFPLVLEHLQNGAVTLTNLRLLGPHLTPENIETILKGAAHRSRQDVEKIVARLRPQPPVPATIRKVSAKPATPTSPAPAATLVDSAHLPDEPKLPAPPTPAPALIPARSLVQPLAPERYKVQFTITTETRETLRRVQDLMRHTVPNGDLALIFERALSLLLADLEKRKVASVDRPRAARPRRTGSRHIPASVKRQVWERDGARCAFVGSHGRCTETGFLEFHHVKPFAAGGPAVAENIQLRCRAHNAYEAELFFGESIRSFVRELPMEWGCGNWSWDQFDRAAAKAGGAATNGWNR